MLQYGLVLLGDVVVNVRDILYIRSEKEEVWDDKNEHYEIVKEYVGIMFNNGTDITVHMQLNDVIKVLSGSTDRF